MVKHMRLEQYINETTKFAKAMQYLNGIKDFGEGMAIFTVMNPMAKGTDPHQNKVMYKELLSILKSKGKKYIKQLGKYGIEEKSVIVVDITLREVMNISKDNKWKQESFIWFKKDGKKMKSYMIGDGNIIKSSNFDSSKSVEALKDFFSTISNRKYSMAFESTVMNESTNQAYFISPRGELISTDGRKHIDIIIKYPKKFGLTDQFIKETYDKYNEKVGLEGKARGEIIELLVKQGWTRIRLYPNKFWTVNVLKMTKKIKDRLYDWADNMVNKLKNDKFMPVRITDTQRYAKQMSLNDIAHDKLFNESEVKEEREVLVIKNIEDLEDMI